MNFYDYEGSMKKYQKMLDDAGVDFDVTLLAGCTEPEIKATVKEMIDYKRNTEQAVGA